MCVENPTFFIVKNELDGCFCDAVGLHPYQQESTGRFLLWLRFFIFRGGHMIGDHRDKILESRS